MKPSHRIAAYGRGAICALALAFATHAGGQSPLEEVEREPYWPHFDRLDLPWFPVSRLDFPTKLEWFGLSVVAPRRLDNIIGFFAYPANKFCNSMQYLPEELVLVRDSLGRSEAATILDEDLLDKDLLDKLCPQQLANENEFPVYYLGFAEKLYGPVAEQFPSPEVFWSTTNAAGLGTEGRRPSGG